MDLKKELLEFLIWIDKNDNNSRVENGHLTALVFDYISNGYNKLCDCAHNTSLHHKKRHNQRCEKCYGKIIFKYA